MTGPTELHLSNFLRSKAYRDDVSSLQGEDLVRLVEYLNSVSLWPNHFSMIRPNTAIGSRVYFKSCEPRIPGILAQTEKYLRRQQCSTEIIHAFKFPAGHRPPVSFRMRTRGDL